MREKTVEERLREEVARIGGKAYKLESTGNAGMPDRMVCLPGGRVIFIELKRPKGGRLSALQKAKHRELRRLGFDVRVVNTTEQVKAFTEEIKCSSTRTITSDTQSDE